MNYALVTGGSRGIGRAIAIRLAQQGFQILINYVSNQTEAQRTLDMAEGHGELLQFGVADSQQTRQALAAWQQQHPEEYISVVVNNAGIRRDNVMALMPEADWHQVVDITLSGFFNVTQPLLPAMQLHQLRAHHQHGQRQRTQGTARTDQLLGSQGGIIAATKALAQEVARRGITVNAIAPGFIKTDMTEGLDEATLKKTIPANRFGTPEEVAALAAFLASTEAGYITGNVVSINGGLYT